MKYKHIMIIDDDKVNNMICENIIKNYNITENVKSFLSTMGALKYIEMTRTFPEILFLDINFAGQPDGWEFLEKYKKLINSANKKTSIYILSSSVAKKDIQRAFKDISVIDYIHKPLTNQKLEAIL